jgi:hypothetical protein
MNSKKNSNTFLPAKTFTKLSEQPPAKGAKTASAKGAGNSNTPKKNAGPSKEPPQSSLGVIDPLDPPKEVSTGSNKSNNSKSPSPKQEGSTTEANTNSENLKNSGDVKKDENEAPNTEDPAGSTGHSGEETIPDEEDHQEEEKEEENAPLYFASVKGPVLEDKATVLPTNEEVASEFHFEEKGIIYGPNFKSLYGKRGLYFPTMSLYPDVAGSNSGYPMELLKDSDLIKTYTFEKLKSIARHSPDLKGIMVGLNLENFIGCKMFNSVRIHYNRKNGSNKPKNYIYIRGAVHEILMKKNMLFYNPVPYEVEDHKTPAQWIRIVGEGGARKEMQMTVEGDLRGNKTLVKSAFKVDKYEKDTLKAVKALYKKIEDAGEKKAELTENEMKILKINGFVIPENLIFPAQFKTDLTKFITSVEARILNSNNSAKYAALNLEGTDKIKDFITKRIDYLTTVGVKTGGLMGLELGAANTFQDTENNMERYYDMALYYAISEEKKEDIRIFLNALVSYLPLKSYKHFNMAQSLVYATFVNRLKFIEPALYDILLPLGKQPKKAIEKIVTLNLRTTLEAHLGGPIVTSAKLEYGEGKFILDGQNLDGRELAYLVKNYHIGFLIEDMNLYKVVHTTLTDILGTAVTMEAVERGYQQKKSREGQKQTEKVRAKIEEMVPNKPFKTKKVGNRTFVEFTTEPTRTEKQSLLDNAKNYLDFETQERYRNELNSKQKFNNNSNNNKSAKPKAGAKK